jgi:hypothetical protein
VVTSLKPGNSIDLVASAYPNPTIDRLTLQISTLESLHLHYNVYSMDGKLLLSEKIIDNTTTIPMNHLQPAIYFMVVKEGNTEVKRFKIVKY